jgi:hypothetical protein
VVRRELLGWKRFRPISGHLMNLLGEPRGSRKDKCVRTRFGVDLPCRCVLRWMECVQDEFSRPTSLTVIAASGRKNQGDNVLSLER